MHFKDINSYSKDIQKGALNGCFSQKTANIIVWFSTRKLLQLDVLTTREKPRMSLEMDRTLDFDCIHLRILDPNVAKFPCSYINCLYVILTALQYKPQFTSPFLQRSLVKLKLKRNILTMWSGLSRIWSLDSDQFQPSQLKQLFCTIDYP